GGGLNTLDYSFYTGDVSVNLLTGQATNIAGGVGGFRDAVGGAGNDVLVGDVADNILRGLGGRDVLIGGAGADFLDGGDDEDLLTAGPTAYDHDAAALDAIRAEWTQPTDYLERVLNLWYGTGLSPALDYSTVFADGGGNVLAGGGRADFFFSYLGEAA